MRHLSVPKRDTQRFADALAAKGWAAKGYRILADGECTLIPICATAPEDLGEEFSQIPIAEMARQPSPRNGNWLTNLRNHLPSETIEQHLGVWPNAQEHFGNLIIFKADEIITEHLREIALAKLEFNHKSRLVLLDRGVVGTFRIRDLQPLAARHQGKILDQHGIGELDEETRTLVTSTRVPITEYGATIITDPSVAYYSARLANERAQTVSMAITLREKLDRPLNIADPYCGVGPAIVQLLRVPDLVGNFLATDLNPAAVELLDENLAASGASQDNQFPTGYFDALTLTENHDLVRQFDVLLMNLPHDALDHLPQLLPLLRDSSPTLLRGWVVLEEAEIPIAEARLGEILASMNPRPNSCELEVRRQYSTTKVLTRFTAQLGDS